MDGVGNVCPLPNGSYEVYSPDGRTSLGTIRHVDPIPTEPDPVSASGSTDVDCVSGASGTYFIHVVYARAYNDADGYNSWAPTIRTMVGNANALVHDATVATGGTGAGLKVLCSGGQIVVENKVLDTPMNSATFSTIVSDLRNDHGMNDPKQKIWVFYDDTGACGCGGTGHWYDDDSDSVNNVNNGNYPSQPFFAVDFGYNSVRIMLHELGHTIGAVQDSAPRSTLAGHCYDGRDTMCYNDGGPNGGLYSTGYCSVEVWDCGRNDYFHFNPASGSYLDTHWNIGSSYVRYITWGEINSGPTMTQLTCTPTTGMIGDTIGCTFTATDTRDNIAYNVNWGDGTTERIPATGYIASGTQRSSSHAYGTDGSFTMSVSASDDNATLPKTGVAMTRTIVIQAAPIMDLLSCSPNPGEVARTITCSFRAADNSSGVFYTLDWGDGSATQRVPATGYVAPGTTRTATRAFSAVGTYAVSANATDNGSPALSSPTITTSLAINANEAPVMEALSCTPSQTQPPASVTCSFRANDEFSGLYYHVVWGDGSPPQRVPASGTVTAGVTQTATHTFNGAGSYTIGVNATDNGSPILASDTMTTLLVIDPNAAPVMQDLSCTPNPMQAQASTTCSFTASDEFNALYYTIDWGDGSSPQRVPASGTVAPGATQSASRTFGTGGTYAVSVNATDNGVPVLTSSAMAIDLVVNPNLAPVMTNLTCTPNPVQAQNPTSCSFRASDTIGVLYYYVDWGDGSSPERVPASGTVAPNVTQSATKTYATDGLFTVSVTATDNASPALTSEPKTLVVNATFANIAPVMVSAGCSPGSAYIPTSCSVRATDTDSTGVKYTIDWGDGSSITIPTTGYATPGNNVPISHTWNAPGVYVMTVTATDNGSPSKTSAPMSVNVTITIDTTPPTLTVNEPRGGRMYRGCGSITQTTASLDAIFVDRGCVRATATDPSGVANVTVRMNGVVVMIDDTAPYEAQWPVDFSLDSTLTVTAYDVHGNARSTNIRVDTV